MNAPRSRFESFDDARGVTRNRPSSEASSRGGTVLPDFPATLARAALDRVLASQTFRRSSRHRHFLDHIVQATLDGEQDRLKEVIIGIEVFGRPIERYDPRRDPIVRVEAGRIREKLARFYQDEGDDEVFELSIPVGSYLPRLIRRRLPTTPRGEQIPLAVLPFTNLTGHADDVGFAIGLTDQLIDALGRTRNLRVVARFSAFKARERESDLKAIGRLLDVSHVVEGSVQRSGARVRCIVHLSQAKTGLHVWSHRFEHDAGRDADAFAFQDEIADAVLAAVVDALLSGGRRRDTPAAAPRPVLSSNAKARDLFERARYHAQQGTIEGFEKAIHLLERAVAIAPEFAQAHSALGAARGNLAPYVFAPTIPSFARVKEAAIRALELDPLDGEARAMLGVIAHRIEGGWTVAEPIFREALRAAPNSMLAHTAYAWGLLFNGRYAEAVTLAERALDLDPLNIGQRAYNARLYAYAGQVDRAVGELESVLELEPDHLFAQVALGIARMTQGRLDEAMARFVRVTRQAPDHSIAHFHVACVLGLKGDFARGNALLAELLGRFDERNASRVTVASARACLNDREGMLSDLEAAARSRDYLFTSVPANILFDRYREDADYLALLHRHGLDLLARP